MFAPRKNELLSNRYITRIRSKGKQSKYYAITPIGIAYLFQKYEPPSDLVTEYFNQIIKHLIFYHEITKPKPGYANLLESPMKIFQIYSNNKPNENKSIKTLQAIFKIMKYVKISHNGSNETGVTLSYPLGLYTDLHYGVYIFIHKITSETTKIIRGKKIITKGFKEVKNVTDWFVEIHLPFQKIDKKIIPFQEYVHTTEKEIYQKIATFIIKAFFYKSITNKIYFYEFEQINKPSRGKTIQFKTEFKNMPKEYLWIVNDFHHELSDILMLNTIELDKIRKVYFDELLA